MKPLSDPHAIVLYDGPGTRIVEDGLAKGWLIRLCLDKSLNVWRVQGKRFRLSQLTGLEHAAVAIARGAMRR